MKRYDVRVLLNSDPMAMAPWHVPDANERFTEVACFAVFADDERTALDEAFAVLNSYPGEMHCGDEYEEVVRSYRAGRNRSLSVGDVLDIGGTRYSCASVGWEVVE